MATLEFDLRDAEAASLQLEVGGRRFPESWNPTAKRPEQRVRKLREPLSKIPLSEQLEAVLWGRLAWSTLSTDADKRQMLVETYVRSLNQLDGFRREVDELVRAACLANLEFRQVTGATHEQAQDAAMNSRLDEMLAVASAEWFPPRNVLNGPVVSQSGPKLREQLDRSLREGVSRFATNFLDLLARLVDRQIMGLVEWHPNHCCSYQFFRQVVIQENEGGGRVVRETLFDGFGNRDADGRRVVGRRTTIDSRGQGKHYHRLARHEHAVMNAVRTSIGNSRVVAPPQVATMLKHVPDWLYSFVEVIDGDIVRERIIERDIKVEQWQDETVSEEPIVVRDEPIYGCEPGVIIGPYVLTGWGPREVAAEQSRRKTQQSSAALDRAQKSAAWRAPWFVGAAAAMTLVAMVLLSMSLRGQGGALFTAIAAAAAIGAVWQAVHDLLTARGRGANAAMAAHWLTASVGCQVLIALWLVARWYVAMPWAVPIALAIAAAVCFAVGRRFA